MDDVSSAVKCSNRKSPSLTRRCRFIAAAKPLAAIRAAEWVGLGFALAGLYVVLLPSGKPGIDLIWVGSALVSLGLAMLMGRCERASCALALAV